jgi:hypothetical protein
LKENLQETPVLGKTMVYCRFSLQPIQWEFNPQVISRSDNIILNMTGLGAAPPHFQTYPDAGGLMSPINLGWSFPVN